MSATWNQSSLPRAVSELQLPVRTACATRLLRLLLLLLLTLPAVVQAQFTYTTNNGTITITGYNGPGGAVVIPDAINGLPVTRIWNGAFHFKTNLTSVTIPINVFFIGNCAFEFCTSLSSVRIPISVASIGDRAFGSCTSLTTIPVDALNPYYSSVDGVLFDKSQTRPIQCPGGKAGSYAIPYGVTNVADGAFRSCAKLTSVTIPNSVTSIGDSAFHSCTRLTSVMIPDSVTNIGDSAFNSCTSLTSVTLPYGLASIRPHAFYSCTRLASVAIPSSVSSIGSAAFSGCRRLTSVTILDGVTSIGNGAFQACTNLTSVMIPKSVTSIRYGAFYGCTSLSAITVDALNLYYSSVDGVLFNKSQTLLIQCPGGKVGSYRIPNGTTGIVDGAFSYCKRLTSVIIPDSITSIGSHVFGRYTVRTPKLASSIATSLVRAQGNAPRAGSFVSDNAAAYDLPGTQDQGTTVAGRPDQFGFTIFGSSNLVIVVEASSDLANPDWIPVETNILTGGSYYFSDSQWTNYPARFYRLRSP